jgi:DNA mismatch repair protein MutL
MLSSYQTMTKIKALDTVTINKIAAGEVIDRPASIVKELIENSLDAGATFIKIHIEDGGKKLIQISDNGCGISKEDLPLAPLRHTTSKISSLEDLYNATSFGFRGEALASISHAANVKITSKEEPSPAYQITVKEDYISTPEQTHATKGTTIRVCDLFEDIPVRRKFLKTNQTELSYITDYVLQFILLRPDIDFLLTSHNKEVLNSVGISSQKALLVNQFTKDLKNHLIKVDEVVGPLSVRGYITDPNLTFSNRQKQYFSVNNRLVNNPTLKKAVEQSYRDIIVPKRFPLLALSIELESETLDVNIHPQKTDVKFLNPGFVFDALKKGIRLALQKHQLSDAASPSPYTYQPTIAQPSQALYTPPSSVQKTVMPSNEVRSINTDRSWIYPDKPPTLPETTIAMTTLSEPQLNENLVEGTYFQVCDTYIIIKGVDAIWMMDQHAVHERVLYEKFKEESAKDQTRQVLLISEVIELSPELFQIYEENEHVFSELNFITEAFGENQITIREIPNSFTSVNLHYLIPDILEQLREEPGSSHDISFEKKERLQMKACKAAIKAGKKLHSEEVKALVTDFLRSPSNYTCPHGRPLYIQMNKSKLEKLFLRT